MAPSTIAQLDDLITRPPQRVVSALGDCSGDFVVLGAGGKMGFHVTRMLQRSLEELGRPDQLAAVSRFSDARARRQFEDHGIRTISADLSQPQAYRQLARAENVFFLAGIKFGTSSDPILLQRMNSEMPQLVAQHYSQSNIVALSTGCVYSFTTAESGGSSEQSPTDPPGEYARSCLLREKAFRDGSIRHETNCVLVRLNYSIDLRYGVLVDIAQQIQAGKAIEVETGYVNVIWQGDAVAHILQCLPHAQSPPFVINVTGGETLSVREIAEMFGTRFGRQPTFEGQESESCWLSDSSLARRLFGEPAVEVEQMVDWIADWLVQGGDTLGKPTQFQVRDGNY